MAIRNRLSDIINDLNNIAGDMVWQKLPEEQVDLIRVAVAKLIEAQQYDGSTEDGDK